MNAETEKTIHSSSSTRSRLASSTGKFETKARTLGMRLAFCEAAAVLSYNRLVLSKISLVIIVRSHVLVTIRSGILPVYPHDYKCEHQSSHVALELS